MFPKPAQSVKSLGMVLGINHPLIHDQQRFFEIFLKIRLLNDGIQLAARIRVMPTNTISPQRLWLGLIPAMIVPFIASLFYFVIFTDSRVTGKLYALTKVFTLLWPLVCVHWLYSQPLTVGRPLWRRHVAAMPLGLLTGAAIVILMLALIRLPLFTDMLHAGSANIKVKTHQLGVLDNYWLFGIFISLIHSLIEEYYWRWFVYGRLRLVVSRTRALFLGSLAFALHHVVVLNQFFTLTWALVLGMGVAMGGILWSCLYDRHQSLIGAWCSHMVVDFGVIYIGATLIF